MGHRFANGVSPGDHLHRDIVENRASRFSNAAHLPDGLKGIRLVGDVYGTVCSAGKKSRPRNEQWHYNEKDTDLVRKGHDVAAYSEESRGCRYQVDDECSKHEKEHVGILRNAA